MVTNRVAQGGRRRVLACCVSLVVLAIPVGPLHAEGVYVKDADGKKTPLLKKVIVQKKTALFGSPGAKVALTPVPAFVIYFVIKDEKNSDEWVRVGATKDMPVGWLKTQATIPWNTRAALRPVAPNETRSYKVFRTNELKKVFMQVTSVHSGYMMLSPVLKSPKRRRDPVFEVAFFTYPPGDLKRKPGRRPSDSGADLETLKLELVFVVDTTGSMAPLLDGTKEVVGRVANLLNGEEFEGSKGMVRIGLVEYKDSDSGRKPSRLIQPLTEKISEFQDKLAPLTVSGGGDLPEDVLAGVMTGIRDSGWSRNSSKHIILVGDARAQLSGPKNTTGQTIESMVKLGRKTLGASDEVQLGNINFHSVQAFDEPLLKQQPAYATEVEICEQQFRQFARNNDEVAGYFGKLSMENKDQRDQVVSDLVNLITRGLRIRKKLASGEDVSAGPIASTGTGFFVTDDGYFVTNAHVVGSASRVQVETRKNGILPARVVHSDTVNDLALLKVEGSFRSLPVISSRGVREGSKVFTFGHPNPDIQGLDPVYTSGDISKLSGIRDDARTFQISVPIQSGNSGGPLVNEHGDVLGVVVHSLNAAKLLLTRGSLPQNVNYAVKSTLLLLLLKEHIPNAGERLKESHASKSRDAAVVRDEVKQATGLILVPEVADKTGAIERAFIRIYRTSGKTAIRPVERGYTRERDENGRQVAHRELLVGRTELIRMRSAFDFLYTQFETRADPSARADIKEVLGFLQKVAAGAISGQPVGPKTSVGSLLSSLPFQSKALRKTAVDIKTMNKVEYDTWLAGIKRAKDRVSNILDTTKFVALSLEGSQLNVEFAFLRPVELP